MKINPEELKLIYVLKVGYNARNEGLYEFVFSKDPETIDYQKWCWDVSPACDNALPPTEDYYDAIFSLKTDKFDLLMENSPKNEQGQIMIPYMNHEISEELCDQIIDEVLGNLRISKRMKQTLRTAIYLGCSPKFKAQQTQ